eukprot:TRINITY_DN22121_c0_g1_i1.p1 TRINITY_DN22121_c0_g1~~TRINITY_DN22121_c0_g1_i1.p1  ORF type:complete len:362 (+),score=50.51 TRINITY_DN22121_c0_g1_i1:73-1158(+)
MSSTENAVVSLNVGGRRFDMLRSTLVWGCEDGTYFTGVLCGHADVDRDAEGLIFIDRNATLFETCLSYMRTGKWECPPGYNRSQVLREASFYGLRIKPCDFTISFIREEQQIQKHYRYQDSLVKLGEAISDRVNELLLNSKDLVFTILPALESMKDQLSSIILNTEVDTAESIDLENLCISDTTQEGVPYYNDEEMFQYLSEIPLEAITWFMNEKFGFSIVIEKGGVCFPYSTTIRNSDELNHQSAQTANTRVASKLHGTLHIYKVPPNHYDAGSEIGTCTTVDTPAMSALHHGDRFANLHQRFFPVCDAWYLSWKDDHTPAKATTASYHGASNESFFHNLVSSQIPHGTPTDASDESQFD